jgi:hypothetical protein
MADYHSQHPAETVSGSPNQLLEKALNASGSLVLSK